MDFAYLSFEEPPKTLYQYTSLEALVSIVQSKRIRASNIRFLNDHSESVWLREHVVSILRKKGISTSQQERIAKIIAMIKNWPKLSLFVASFTEKPDDLSQWRAYCPPGLGVSIGFATECLGEQWVANPLDPDRPFFMSANLQRTRYYSTDHQHDLEKAIDQLLGLPASVEIDSKHALLMPPALFPFLIERIAEMTGQEETIEQLKSIKTIPVWLSLVTPLFKHDAFKDEVEWRKIISKDIRLMPGMKFRKGKSTLIPYVEIMLDTKRDGASHVPQEIYFVNEVIIGPTPTPELTIEAVRALFDSEGHPDVRVRISDIPFRSW